VRAVLDPNVIISELLAPSGDTALLLRAWQQGRFELVVSAALLTELERALSYPRLRRRIPEEDARAVLQWLTDSATSAADPDAPPAVRSADSGDDYLIALAASRHAVLVSGDRHLLRLADQIPVYSPARFLELLSAPPAARGE
jgi:putative PIN family toxin of toxin-antitoxin system